MERFDKARKSNIQQVLEKVAINARNSFHTHGNTDAKDYHFLLQTLPAADSPVIWIQNPASGNYGKFIFLVDYSVVDGDDIIV